jgi:hypothetical protein
MTVPISFAFSVLLSQQKLVTVNIPGARLEVAESELSRAFGEPVTIGTSLKQLPIVIMAKDVSVHELREKIALALNASWEKKQTGWVLFQTSEQKKAEDEYSRKEKLRLVEQSLAKKRKAVQDQKAFNPEVARMLGKELELLQNTNVKGDDSGRFWRRLQQVDAKGPVGRFGNAFALRIPPEMFTVVSNENPRVVFSSSPTRMQLPLKVNFTDLYQTLVKEQQIWADYAKGKRFEGPEVEGGGRYVMGDLGSQTKEFDAAPGLVHVIVTGGETNVSLELKIYSRKNRKICSFRLDDLTFSFEDNDYDNWRELQKELEERAKKIQYSDRAKEFKQVIREDKQTKPSQTLFQSLLQPESIDPSNYLLPDILNHIRGNRNVVMIPTFFESIIGEQMVLAKPNRWSGTNRIEDDRWLVMHPINRKEFKRTEVDRKTLGTICRAVAKGGLSLEKEAQIEYLLPWEIDSGYGYKTWMKMIAGPKPQSYQDRSALRIWACLPMAFKQGNPENKKDTDLPPGYPIQNQRTSKFTFGDLSQNCQLEFHRAIFSQQYGGYNSVDYESLTPEMQQGNSMQEMYDDIYQGIGSEMTYNFGNGIPNSTPITISSYEQDALWLRGEGEYSYERSMTAFEMGRTAFYKENPSKYPWANNRWDSVDLQKIRILNERLYTIKMKVTKFTSRSWSLSDRNYLDDKTYSIDSLPDRFRKQYQAGYKEAKEQDRFNVPQPQGGSTIPPLLASFFNSHQRS